jgi:aminopeptidase N
MKTTENPRAIHLKDYKEPLYRIPSLVLSFVLEPEATRVTATMKVVKCSDHEEPLVLDGKNLKLIAVMLDGEPLSPPAYSVDDAALTLNELPPSFVLEIETEIAPAQNTALEGLYMSNGIYCTQCEPEGFRAITYYLDRPDNLAKFETRIEAPKAAYPVLLSNGNLIEQGELTGGRHFAVWQDPFPKPSYLFALVAGDLGHIRDSYVTSSGREVDLRIYVEHGNESRAAYAMDSLKRSMRWDEEVYGREYDLDIFMIVAVSAFNFGAMENKGLNVFNDKLLLASPETATDDDYARIECVVGHEYFHNWTGNRITCRDWFQLSLKEGLTVFRESGFAGDMRSHAVRRITDVKDLRLRQFQEDAGPLAHPVQPQSYIAIDNFYTATVYEKGAEIIGMLKAIVGPEHFREGMDLYFARHDGEAATVEDFVRCFEDVSGRDLLQFRLWYRQAGTPEIEAIASYDRRAETYRLVLNQKLAPTPGQPLKKPMHIPVAVSLLGSESRKPLALMLDGENAPDATEKVLDVTEPSQEFVFHQVKEKPVLSLGRDFSAPVKFHDGNGREERAFLVSHDTDSFNRWEAGQKLASESVFALIEAVRKGAPATLDAEYLAAMEGAIARANEDPGFTALMLMPPSEQELALGLSPIDPESIHLARREFVRGIAAAHGDGLRRLYETSKPEGAFSPDAGSAGRRALRNAALRYVTAADDEEAARIAHAHYRTATNMTDMMAGLASLARMGGTLYEDALTHFHDRFADNPLVLDKWMGVQAMSPLGETIARVRRLMSHKAFSLKNPNRVRALIGAFANANPLRFHDRSGEGYALLGQVICALDEINPQTAARMTTAFESWVRYDEDRQKRIREQLGILAACTPISPNLYEIVMKISEAKPA